MTVKIPSSLKWLMRKYQEHERELRKTEHALVELAEKKIKLTESVESLKRVIELHEIPVTASDVELLGKTTKRTGLAYGKVTKLIYQYLGCLPEGCDATVSEILAYCLNQTDWKDFSDHSIQNFRLVVRKRLQNLADGGRIIRTQHGTKKLEPKFKASPFISGDFRK